MVHRLGKRAVASLAAATLAVGGMVGVGLRQSNAATPLVGVCQLSGTANFTPNVKATPQTLSYTFSGSFSGCKGNAGVTSGSVSASGSGKLGCAEGTSNGTATINWSNGQSSSATFSTTSAAALTAIRGKVSSGMFAGETTAGAIVFTTTTPQLCASTGLSSLSFKGAITVG